MKNRIVGHRGYGVCAPENTMIALDKSHALGLKHVEFDVRLTQDNVLVITHDDSLLRCAQIDQLVSETNYEDLKDVNMAKYFALEASDQNLPTLLEYIERARELGLHCQIELKPNAGQESRLVDEALSVIEDFYAETDDADLPLITSFSAAALKEFKEKETLGCKTGILIPVEKTSKWQGLAEAAQADFVHVHALYLLEEFAQAMRNQGYGINGYHLNSPILAEKAISLGCERFTCDIPELFN